MERRVPAESRVIQCNVITIDLSVVQPCQREGEAFFLPVVAFDTDNLLCFSTSSRKKRRVTLVETIFPRASGRGICLSWHAGSAISTPGIVNPPDRRVVIGYESAK